MFFSLLHQWLHSNISKFHLKQTTWCCVNQTFAQDSDIMNLQDFGSAAPICPTFPEKLNMLVEVVLCIMCFLLLMVVMLLRDLARAIDHMGQVRDVVLLLERIKDLVTNLKVQMDILIEPRTTLAEEEIGLLTPRMGSSRDIVLP